MNPTDPTEQTAPLPAVFVRATGQADNIGDSILRRGLLRSLRAVGPLHVLIRGLPTSYVDGLDLRSDDATYVDEKAWLAAARTTSRSRPVVFCLNAGEFQFNRTYALQYLAYLPMILRSSRSGGFSAQLGAGARVGNSGLRWVIGPVIRRLTVAVWRDRETRDALSVGTVMPDWAFGEGSPDEWLLGEGFSRDRPRLAISMRGDRPFPSPAWFEAVRALAQRDGLTPVLVVQVASDADRAKEIAKELDTELVSLRGRSHREQEEVVRAVYRDSSVVISDRLHALILAVTEGAIPVGLVDGGSGKLARHFRAVQMDDVVVDSKLESIESMLEHLDFRDATRAAAMQHVLNARAELEQVSSSLVALGRTREAST